ncbi:cellulose synthase [Burkholderia sp. SRS-W-2-2016]|nr:cellulose synthase [Burkholderia sp. SRS-W-2-2016]
MSSASSAPSAAATSAAAAPAAPATAPAPAAAAPNTNPFAKALAEAANPTVRRTIALNGLGISGTTTLDAPASRREFYFPVPAGVPIADGELQLDSSYLRADGGRTTLLVSIDGTPALARALTQPQGDAALAVGVGGDARPSGYVRIGLDWSSVVADTVCSDQTAIGNVLRVAPLTSLSYRYDTRDIKDLRTAWSALPLAPTLLISSAHLDTAHYDAGWRELALLQRDGREPQVRAWPAPGDTVELGAPAVPAALQTLPAFAALAAGGPHRVANPAELAALLVIAPRGALPLDLILMDDTLRASLNGALDALAAQAANASPDARDAFAAWRAQVAAPLVAPLAAGELRLVHIGGQAAIVAGDTQGIAALAQMWRAVNVSNQLVVHELDGNARHDVEQVSLAALGGEPGTLSVLREAQWQTRFDLAAAAGAGRLPDDVVLELAAAPNSHGSGVVASIYFNDALIGAQLLNARGRNERVSAHIPRYLLAASNTLRVAFQRQSDGGCARAEGYPVAVLPGSHLTLAKADAGDTFTGMVGRYASGSAVYVPAAYPARSTDTLARVAHLANAVGIAPQRAVLRVAADGERIAPAEPFLALGVAVERPDPAVRVQGDGLTIADPQGRALYAASGVAKLAGVSVFDVVRADRASGIVWRSLGEHEPVLPASLQLQHGNVAVVSGDGVLKTLDTRRADGALDTDDDERAPWRRQWWTWAVPTALVGAFALLLLLATVTRRRKQRRSQGTPE